MSSPVGLIDGLTSAIGDELNTLGGIRSTRLTAQALPERQLQDNVNNADYTQSVTALLGTWTWNGTNAILSDNTSQVSALNWIRLDADAQYFRIESISLGTGPGGEDVVFIENPDSLTIPSGSTGSSFLDPAVVTISSGTFDLSIVSGYRFRILSGPAAGVSALIDTRDSGVQITLQTGLPVDLSSNSWEIVIDADTSVSVETTLDWPDGTEDGRVFIDGVDYRYTSKTLTTLDGLTHWDGTQFVQGVAQQHEPLAEVFEYSQSYSAVELLRRALLVEYAEGEDLNIIGRRVSVPRPPGLDDDDLYRELIQAVGYSSRGTMKAIEGALNALLGENNWEIFEDLTLDPINNKSTIFLRRLNLNEEQSEGRTWLTGREEDPITSTTEVDIQETPIRVHGLTIADEPLLRLIDKGTGINIEDQGELAFDPGAGFSSEIRPGDILQVTSGALAGQLGTIVTATASDVTMVSNLAQTALEGSSHLTIDSNLTVKGVSYLIYRPVSNFRHYKPTEETYLEFNGDAGTAVWDFVGTDEGTDVVLASDGTDGRYMIMADQAAGDTTTYRHRMRIAPESKASFEVFCSIPSLPSGGASDGLQFAIRMHDGEKQINVGVFGSGGDARFRFVDSSGTALTGSFQDVSLSTYVNLKIVKDGRGLVRFYVNNILVDSEPYSSFSSSTDREIEFGMFDTSLSGMFARIKQVDWSASTYTDFWNAHVPNGGLSGDPSRELFDNDALGLFLPSDALTKRVRIKDFTALNAAGGNPRGEWLIESYNNADSVVVNGPTFRGATFDPSSPARVVIKDNPFAFVFPDYLGHRLVIDSGPNAGTYDIEQFLDPVTFQDLSKNDQGGDIESLDDMPSYVFEAGDLPTTFNTNVLQVSNPPVNGFQDDDDASWHIEPVFATDGGPVSYEIVDAGTVAGTTLTLRQALPFGIAGSYTPLVSVLYTKVLSAQLLDPRDKNREPAPGVYDFYPAYLADNFGLVRDVVKALTAAGVIPDFDSLIRDSTGPHLLS